MNAITPVALQKPGNLAIVQRHEAARIAYVCRTNPALRPPYIDTIPNEALPALLDALNAALLPATPRQIDETIAVIFGSWPYAGQRVDPTSMDIHVQLLREDLAEFPPDILLAAVRDLRRRLKFAPSIAELYDAATVLLKLRNYLLRDVEKRLGRPGAGMRYDSDHYRPTPISGAF